MRKLFSLILLLFITNLYSQSFKIDNININHNNGITIINATTLNEIKYISISNLNKKIYYSQLFSKGKINIKLYTPPGIYLIKVQSGKKRLKQKIIQLN